MEWDEEKERNRQRKEKDINIQCRRIDINKLYVNCPCSCTWGVRDLGGSRRSKKRWSEVRQ